VVAEGDAAGELCDLGRREAELYDFVGISDLRNMVRMTLSGAAYARAFVNCNAVVISATLSLSDVASWFRASNLTASLNAWILAPIHCSHVSQPMEGGVMVCLCRGNEDETEKWSVETGAAEGTKKRGVVASVARSDREGSESGHSGEEFRLLKLNNIRGSEYVGFAASTVLI